MKILPIHTEALRYLGYTEEEAQFLYLVATHSGYFTCRQFLQFIETKAGKSSVAFARKVVKKKQAQRNTSDMAAFFIYSRAMSTKRLAEKMSAFGVLYLPKMTNDFRIRKLCECRGSTESPIVVSRSFWREIFLWKKQKTISTFRTASTTTSLTIVITF